MNYRNRGIRFSLIVHIAVLAVIVGAGNSVAPVSKPIVIDFNIEEEAVPKKIEVKSAPPKPRKQKTETVEQKQPVKPIEQPAPHPVIDRVTESPAAVPVAAPKISDASPQAAEKASTAAVQKAAPAKPAAEIVSVASKPSHEEAKKRYLKEHFTYIRDIIMKNLSYPHIARKRGWSGKVTVSFVVREDGNVENEKVVEGSGFSVLDNNAVETIKKACPFPRPPAKAELIIPVVYRLE
jgi:protein TonB